MKKQRVAILGSGVGAITAAWALTNLPNARDRFDITLYTLGWRLGGKGASGRNADFGQRIEEHGLHIWMGFYDNAFRAMQECYRELNRPPTCPVRSWTDAFVQHDNMVLYEFSNGHWRDWLINVPRLPGTPGAAREPHEIRDLFEALLRWMHDVMTGPMHEPAVVSLLDKWRDSGRPGWVKSELAAIEDWVRGRGAHEPSHVAWLMNDLHAAVDKAANLAEDSAEHFASLLGCLESFLKKLEQLAHDFIEAHEDIRRLWVLMDLAVAVARGMIKDGVLWHGFDRISGVDFRQWIHNHGASQEAKASSVVRTMYDLCFAYEDGELDRPNMDAAVFLRTIMLMGFTYRGSFMYRLAAGMGDVVFGPYYEALKTRGVKFEFFQRVTKLGLSDDRHTVATINIDRQVSLKAGVTDYQPFVDVKGLPCWPSTPQFDQIEGGEALKASGQNLESSWCTWPVAESRVLEVGRDFDQVILGISLGALKGICGELIDASPAWKKMCDQVLTVETQGVQLWLKASLADLGWTGPPTVAGTY
ncbi:MAG: NAD(P)-binding protein, partial [Vicinamibacterales bacterium]